MIAAMIKSAIVLAAAAVVASLMRRQSAAVRHAVWTAGLIGAMAIPLFTLTLPEWQTSVAASAVTLFQKFMVPLGILRQAAIGIWIAGAAAGIGGLMAAQSASDDAEATANELEKTGLDSPCYTRMYEEACQERARKKSQIAPLTILGVGGLALAGTGVALIIYELARANSDNAKGVPIATFIVTPGGGALGLMGTF